jgi:hypothetical protein
LSVNGYRLISEAGNNLVHPTWGAARTDLIRLTPAAFTKGYNTPSLAQDPSAGAVSNILNSQADPSDQSQDIATVNLQSLSDLVYAFGPFMYHDMVLTPGNGASDPISVAPGDPIGGTNDVYWHSTCRRWTPPRARALATRPGTSTPSIRSSTCCRSTASTKPPLTPCGWASGV